MAKKMSRKNTLTKIAPLSSAKLRWICPEDKFNFKSTKEIKPLDKIINQHRAIESITLGANIKARGYNIFVTGLSGTGRTSTVKKILEDTQKTCPILHDYCYVNNFENPDEPILISLAKGKGKKFATAMDDTMMFLRRRLPKLFEEDVYQKSRKKLIEHYQEKERDILQKFDDKIEPFGFVRGQLENEQGAVQPEVFPLIKGKPVQIETLDELVNKKELTSRDADKLTELWKKFHEEIFDLNRQGMKLMQEFRKELLHHDKKAAGMMVDSTFDELLEHYDDTKIVRYIESVKKYILENLGMFVQTNAPIPQLAEINQEENDSEKFNIFSVNVLLDNSETDSAPIIIETSPNYTNLFGTIEKSYDRRGMWKTDFTKIKAGALLRADKGFLIVNANDLFQEPGVWVALKRVLLNGKIEIMPYDTYFQVSQSHLKPEPIEVNVKVVIIGGQTLYRALYNYEKGFKKIFKICAQFDYETKLSDEIMENYTQFITKICKEENYPAFDPSGVAAVMEWAVEKAGSQNRITLKFSDVADVIRESAYYANDGKGKFINRDVVEKAIELRRLRNDLYDEKIRDQIVEGTLMIDTDGERIGQINGLTVYNNGIFSFGKPARITASVSPGTNGIINIEREADMSGKIHNKGVLIITGFFREKFAKNRPLAFTASIAFEQSYGGIDGDSASAAEIYTILSAISGVPINQHFAITGSVNQKGDIQPIGGVNEKLLGFYEVCRERGLDGNHAAIIPESNVKDLMLDKKLVADVEKAKFNVYPIQKIEDAIPLLFGIEAGEVGNDGKYPQGTLFEKVETRLDELFKIAKNIKEEKKNTKRVRKSKNEEEPEKEEK